MSGPKPERTPKHTPFIANLTTIIEASMPGDDWAGFVTPDHMVVRAGEIDRMTSEAKLDLAEENPNDFERISVATMQAYNIKAKRAAIVAYISIPMSEISPRSFDALAETISMDAVTAANEAMGHRAKDIRLVSEVERPIRDESDDQGEGK